MSTYTAHLRWQRTPGETFTDQRYSRRHTLSFDGGVVLSASSAPSSVPLPYSDASAVDPEEMFVASLSSCHMLWFLSLAAGRGHVVEQYEDAAEGLLARDAEQRLAMTQVTLRPRVTFAAPVPDAAAVAALHHAAHERCFIANSVKTEVRVLPQEAA